MKKCLLCGRKLNAVRSRSLGYGPVCYDRVFGKSVRIRADNKKSAPNEIPCYDIPGQMSIEDFLDADNH